MINKSQLLALLGPDIKRIAREVMTDMQADLRVAGDALITGRLSARQFSWEGREVELGWIKDNITWFYGSSTTILIYGDDVSDNFPAGTKLRWKQGGGYLYGTVISASYSSGTTTITVIGDTVTNTDITDNYFSYDATPPGWTDTTMTFVPLSTPLTSTSWDGDSFSTTAKTKIDLSAVFGVPAGVKAVSVWFEIRDSGANTNNCFFGLSPNDTAGSYPVSKKLYGLVNDIYYPAQGTVPCDSNGDIYYQCIASGEGTLDVKLEIWGYWI